MSDPDQDALVKALVGTATHAAPRPMTRPERVARSLTGQNPDFNAGLADIGRRYMDYYSTAGDALRGKYTSQPEVRGQWSEGDQERAGRAYDALFRRGAATALDAMTGSLPFAKSHALGSGGGRAAAAQRVAPELSAAEKAEKLGFHTRMPLEFGTAPAGEKIASAALNLDNQIFRGPSHLDAMLAAEKKLGKPFDEMRAGPIMDGFWTTGDRYVSRWEGQDVANRAAQRRPADNLDMFERSRGATSESIDMASPGQSAGAYRTGATAPGLPGGRGPWGWSLAGSRLRPGTEAMWHRSERPGVLDAEGLREHEIPDKLSEAWGAGHDSVMLRNYTGPDGRRGDVVVVRDPAQLRSPRAAFDPAKKDVDDILAVLTGAPSTGPLVGNYPSEGAR